MSVNEESIKPGPPASPAKAASGTNLMGYVEAVLRFLSSVRFGVTLLVILVILSMIGMLIIQQNVDGFDSYYASLTPAERTVYGALGLFDIYHVWYYNLLLLVLSLNIVLASIERFPSAWSYIRNPKKTATAEWLKQQQVNSEYVVSGTNTESVIEKLRGVFDRRGFTPEVTETTTKSYAVDDSGKKDFSRTIESKQAVLFGERGKYNRLGAYIVHVTLLTLFLGHAVALMTGFDADVRMIPGDASDQIEMIRFELDKRERFAVQLPFTVTCTDVQQKLIDPSGAIDVTNTLDWRTQIRIDDPEYGTTIADVSMNNPFHYRGFRFFQAQTVPIGNAREIKIQAVPVDGGEPQTVNIMRLGSTTLADGTVIEYDQFLPDFTFNQNGEPDTRSGEYNNPAAVLSVTPPGGERQRVFAFGSTVPDNIPISAPKAGYKWRLNEFEKAPFAHILSIKYDPYNGAFIAWYFGGVGLMAALVYVFFFSHRRIWANVEEQADGTVKVILGGHTNRNHKAFEDIFNKVDAEAAHGLGQEKQGKISPE